MNLGIITANRIFEESLKSLLENYRFRNDKPLIVKNFSLDTIEGFDVIVSDYQLGKLKDFLSNSKIQKNKILEVEKILITEDGFELLPKGNAYIRRPFKFFDLVEVLNSILERQNGKRQNKKTFGYISYLVTDRELIYKDKKSVRLTEKESDIILSLMSSSDKGITKEEVMSKVWMLNQNIETHTFETHLYRLRKKIKESLFLNNFIINIKGRYYLNHEFTGKKN